MISFTQKYFFRYLFFARNRQKLLILALLALSLSSFALLVIQSTMGGMQKQVVERNKNIEGVLEINILDHSIQNDLIQWLKSFKRQNRFSLNKKYNINKLNFIIEATRELLLRNSKMAKPVIVHGVDKLPSFIDGSFDKSEMFMSNSLAYSISLNRGDTRLSLYSPIESDSFIFEIPSRITILNVDFFETGMDEIDSWNVWININKMHNLVKNTNIDKIVVYNNHSELANMSKNNSSIKIMIKSLKKTSFASKIKIVRWEQKHKNLIWSLKLENMMMIFLFASMSILATISIISGLSLFWEKIKYDLSFFWMVGVPRANALKTVKYFLFNLNIISILLGIGMGSIFLILFQSLAPNLMPDIFLDRTIPVQFKSSYFIFAFLIPFVISNIFCSVLIHFIGKEIDFLKLLKR